MEALGGGVALRPVAASWRKVWPPGVRNMASDGQSFASGVLMLSVTKRR